MKTPKFELSKMKRAISWQGNEYSFIHEELDIYKRPDPTKSTTIVIKGLYHEVKGYVQITSSDAVQIKSKPQPMILSLLEDSKLLTTGDKLTIGTTNYEVVHVNDIGNFGIIGDVSLEVIQ